MLLHKCKEELGIVWDCTFGKCFFFSLGKTVSRKQFKKPQILLPKTVFCVFVFVFVVWRRSERCRLLCTCVVWLCVWHCGWWGEVAHCSVYKVTGLLGKVGNWPVGVCQVWGLEGPTNLNLRKYLVISRWWEMIWLSWGLVLEDRWET